MNLDHLAAVRFGIPYLRPFQRLVVDTIAEHDRPETLHRSLLVILPTGSGKSLCFMLPTLFVQKLVIIVYPLLALMEDQRRRFEEAGIACVVLKGGQEAKERQRIFRTLDAGCNVLITNAETLASPPVLAQLGRRTISLLVIDEAHTVVSWGEGFRPKLAELGSLAHHLPIRQLLLFTATADESVLTGLRRLFGTLKVIHGNSDRPNISYHMIKTLSKRRTLTTVLQLPQDRPALVFCPTRASCEQLQDHYEGQNPDIPSAFYHAGLSKEQRTHLQRWFINDCEGVLFSTNAFGMGIDKKDLRTVVHTYLPPNVLSYLQESGRGGRDGKRCHAVVLMDRPEDTLLGRLFWSSDCCYRLGLLSLLGEEIEHCSGCDWCNNERSSHREGERAITAAVRQRPFGFTKSSLATRLLIDRRFDHLSGHLCTWHPAEVNEAIGRLIDENNLIQSPFGARLFLPVLRHPR